MRYIDVKISVPDGYSILQRPIEWSKPGDCFSFDIPDLESNLFSLDLSVTELEMTKLIECFDINNWLFNQSAKLKGITYFKIGIYNDKVFRRSRGNMKSKFYTVSIEKRSIYGFYLISSKEELKILLHCDDLKEETSSS